MLSPKRTKFRKYHRGKMRGNVFVRISFFFKLEIWKYLL